MPSRSRIHVAAARALPPVAEPFWPARPHRGPRRHNRVGPAPAPGGRAGATRSAVRLVCAPLSPAENDEGRAVAGARDWVAGARPRTLPAAIVPVVVGSGVAIGYGRLSPWRAALALLVALALQVGVNYANDYSDGIRGTDERRVGPVRLVALRPGPAPAACSPPRSAASRWPAWPGSRWPR